ncbi:uncharacterized protein KY384_000497 [Bacidia gigantensis]|uniref:uncharacterized protein n=1 Tax=Bacidia gigantensis TaxID=2732470 RepID=UPI001D046EA6|nr:uncharacterized protein KY384_000497 [Bacidia gigantensis]KAG8525737.1 hypothetical protein KY384_000497 [Bacidia gigantensis]
MASQRPDPFPNATTITLSAEQLDASPHFPPLYALENEAFAHAHTKSIAGKEFLPKEVGRFYAPQDMLDEIGTEGLCMIAFEKQEGSEIIGTISAKPFHEPKIAVDTAGKHSRMLFKRSVSEKQMNGQAVDAIMKGEEEAEKWELLASVVSLRVKGMGVASMLMEKCVAEIKRRSIQNWHEKQRAGNPKIVLYLSTMQELNEVYYQKRGWTTTSTRRIPAGTTGNRDEFGIVEMMKTIPP